MKLPAWLEKLLGRKAEPPPPTVRGRVGTNVEASAAPLAHSVGTIASAKLVGIRVRRAATGEWEDIKL